jgi:hypothetical protein
MHFVDPLGLDEIDTYHRDLFNYYQSMMQVMTLVGNELHSNGISNIGKQYPWLSGQYNCSRSRGAVAGKDGESELAVQTESREKDPFPIQWPKLAKAMSYSQREYGKFADWSLTDGSSYNLHGLWFLGGSLDPRLHLGKEPFLAGPREAIETLIHEPMHDLGNYGFGHGGGMGNIVPLETQGYPASSKYGSAYEQYVDFLQAAKDQNGVSLWDKLKQWVGPMPTKPISTKPGDAGAIPSYQEYERQNPLLPIN